MNSLLKRGLTSCLKKINNSCQLLPKYTINAPILQNESRSFWHMVSVAKVNSVLKISSASECCRYNQTGLSHSNGERDLVEFLQDEIAQEKKSLKMKNLPAELDGFAITTNQAELSFTKKTNMEVVMVSMNVNHSVDAEDIGEDDNFAEEMKAKPSFEIEIQRNGKTLCFSCSYTQFEEHGDKGTEDNFEITEVKYFEGDWQDKTYSVAADLLDENLYDLFMVILEEKGITKKFVEKVSEIATSHEHSQYIHLLENVRKFASVN